MNKKITAVVTGAGGVYGLGTIRNLRRANLPLNIVATDCNPTSAGLFLADVAVTLPEANDSQYVASLSQLCREYKADIIFVASGQEIPVVSKQRDSLEKSCGAVIIVNSPQHLAITEDKCETLRKLKGAGLRVPLFTIDCEKESLNQFAGRTDFPIIVKPRFGSGAHHVRRCDDISTLVAAMSADGEWIAQKLIGDDDHEYTVGVLGTEEGDILGSIILRRYLKNGLTAAAEVVIDQQISAYAEDVTRQLRPRGYCNVQIRLDCGAPCAFEVNGRVSSSTSFRGLAGFNEPELLIRYYVLQEKSTPPKPQRVRMVRAFDEFTVDDERWWNLVGH